MSVMKASIVAFLGGVKVQGQSLTQIMTSHRLLSIASQNGGQSFVMSGPLRNAII